MKTQKRITKIQKELKNNKSRKQKYLKMIYYNKSVRTQIYVQDVELNAINSTLKSIKIAIFAVYKINKY